MTYKTTTITVASDATVTRDDKTAALSDIQVGDRVSISSSTDGTYVRADRLELQAHVRRARHGRGPGGGHGGPPPTSTTDHATPSTTGG